MSEIHLEIADFFAADGHVVGIAGAVFVRIVYRQFLAVRIQIATKIAGGQDLKLRGGRFDRNTIRLSAYRYRRLSLWERRRRARLLTARGGSNQRDDCEQQEPSRLRLAGKRLRQDTSLTERARNRVSTTHSLRPWHRSSVALLKTAAATQPLTKTSLREWRVSANVGRSRQLWPCPQPPKQISRLGNHSARGKAESCIEAWPPT